MYRVGTIGTNFLAGSVFKSHDVWVPISKTPLEDLQTKDINVLSSSSLFPSTAKCSRTNVLGATQT